MRKIQSSNFKVAREVSGNQKPKLRTSMPTIECTCGEKILVVPDVAAMERAIKNHKAKHKSVNEQHLTEKILKAVSKQMLQQA
ncbi:MAG: hypothetical protein ACLQO7_08950 [Candidatus Bathyarchaeia archaeon]